MAILAHGGLAEFAVASAEEIRQALEKIAQRLLAEGSG